jgi:four helix bundle protein
MQDYRKLRVWQRAHQMAVDAYTLPKYLRQPECWPLRDQILRAAISIQSNVAEGAGRGSNPDFLRFCWHSMGSCNEFETDVMLAYEHEVLASGRAYPVRERSFRDPNDADSVHGDIEVATNISFVYTEPLATGNW